MPVLVLMGAGREASASWSQRPGHGGLESAARPDSNPRSVVSAEQKKRKQKQKNTKTKKEEQATQRGKGKGKGQPDNRATIPQTFEV